MATEGQSELDRAGLRFQIGIFEEALRESPEDTEVLRFLSHAYAAIGQLEEGLAIDRRLVALLPTDPRARYNLACACALAGRQEEALTVLQAACELGFDDLNLVRRDSDLDSVRETPRFKEIEATLATRREDGK